MAKTQKTKKTPDTKGKILIIALCASIMVGGGLVARSVKPSDAAGKDAEMGDVATVSISDHQPIKAEIVDKNPSKFTIDVEKLANLNADDNADTFAVYTSDSKPDTCGDFRDLELAYEKPEEYKRVFDLSEHPEVLKALDSYHCVVMKNIPPSAS